MNDVEESKSSEDIQNLHCAGIIITPHGIQGHVKIKTFLENPMDLQIYSPFYDEQGREAYRIKKVFFQAKDVLVVALEGVVDRTGAEALRGVKLMFSREKLPEIGEDSFYHVDLIGLKVISSQGQLLGTVQALYNFGAGDIMEVKKSEGTTTMFSFSRDLVPDINIEAGRVHLSGEGDQLLLEKSKNA